MKTLTMKLKMKTNKNLYFFILLPLFLVLGCFLFKKTEATIVTPDFQGVGSGIWTDGTYQFIYDGSKLSQIKTDPIPFYYQVENYPPSRTLIIEPGYKIIKQTEPSGSTPGEVLFREDGNTYYPAYNVSTGGGVGQPQTGCSGGLKQYITCVPNTGWEKDVCPHDVALNNSSSADPHYCQGSVSFELKFKEIKELGVQIFVAPASTGVAQATDATIKYGEGVEIRWTTTNASDLTICECTYGEGQSCGTSYGKVSEYKDPSVGFLYPQVTTKYTVSCCSPGLDPDCPSSL